MITTIILAFLITILFGFDKKIKNKDEQIENLNKRFKTIEELNEIRLDIRELQKEIFKNGKKR